MNRSWNRRALGAALVGLLLWLGSNAPFARAEVKEGQPAPAVELPATKIGTILPDKKDAKTLNLKELHGKKNVVLFFFPKAMTKG